MDQSQKTELYLNSLRMLCIAAMQHIISVISYTCLAEMFYLLSTMSNYLLFCTGIFSGCRVHDFSQRYLRVLMLKRHCKILLA